ncbi:glycosyltransferase [Photobacterium damselae]|uniref:glycosyltransferase n=1 Tax=Photobacterium damselae TaxID=38293 RepID=UPI000D04F05F|nr:glycosyltransferase [Photobacterium damselae]PSB80708.1 hypothetical protein C5F62_14005 [Photobacterium damselae subsp. damselae]
MNILINASAAHEGGALTILNTYLQYKCKEKSTQDIYYVLSPVEPTIQAPQIYWIRKSTLGYKTYLFTLFFSYYYYLYYGCEKCISFNNFNFIFPSNNKFTYFHNLLIINGYGKFRLLRFTLKYLNQLNSNFIFQTPYVYKQFESVIGKVRNHIISWPGVASISVNDYDIDKYFDYRINNIIVPISNIYQKHKNFDLLLDIASNMNDVNFIIPAENNVFSAKNLTFVGSKKRDELLNLINHSDGVLITSKFETVCLPIFESLFLKKNVYVFDSDYVSGLLELFGNIEGLFLYKDINDFKSKLKENVRFRSTKTLNRNIFEGKWDF